MSVSHCVAAPHMSRGAPQLCPTYKGLEIVPISKNTTQKLFFSIHFSSNALSSALGKALFAYTCRFGSDGSQQNIVRQIKKKISKRTSLHLKALKKRGVHTSRDVEKDAFVRF